MTQPAGWLGRWAFPFFFFTGITGLVYEVLWTRRLTLTFGHTVLAVSTVLTAYMAGLALGSLLGGRWADRHWGPGRSPGYYFAAYGRLELMVGAWALASLPLLGLVEAGYLHLASRGVTGLALQLACFAGSVAVLVLPTAAMGAKLPVMTRVLVREEADLGPRLARLYGLNTLGAFVGALLAGFTLFPAFGLASSLVGTALVNLFLGAASWWLGVAASRSEVAADAIGSGAAPEAEVVEAVGEPTAPLAAPGSAPSGELAAAAATPGGDGAGPASRPFPRFLVPLAFGLTGAASMVYQVGWTRGLVLSLGSSTYAFSAILAVFLAGLGLGSLLYPRIFRRPPDLAHLAWLQVGIAVAGALILSALGHLPQVLLEFLPLVRGSFLMVVALDLAVAALLLLPPSLMMGMGFPLATRLYSQDIRLVGRDVGEVYGANTLGCIVGSFAAGFGLIPHLGVQATLRTAVLLNLAVAVALFLARRPLPQAPPSRGPALRWGLLAVLATGGLLAVLPGWNAGVMTSGVAIYRRDAEHSRQDLPAPAHYRDGLSASISIHLLGRQLALRTNGKADASTGQRDMLTQRLLGILGGLLHPRPRQILVIGLGSGITVDSARRLPGVERVDCVELEPAVIEANHYWTGHNGHALGDPRVHVWATDGRTFILGSPRRYDLIVSEPSNPWIAGIGNLFTRDFYRACASRLESGGLMIQWLQLYGMSEEDLGLVLRGFFEVFPEGQVWNTNEGDTVLVGSLQPVELDPARLSEIWHSSPDMQRHLFELGLSRPEEITGHYTCNREDVLGHFHGSRVNTDDRPLLEFSAPRSLYDEERVGRNFRLLQGLRTRLVAPGLANTAENRLAAGAIWVMLGMKDLARLVLDSDPSARGTLEWDLLEARLLAGENRPDEARRGFRSLLVRWPGNGRVAGLWADLEWSQGQWSEAERLYRVALADPPPGAQAWLWLRLGQALGERGRVDEAAEAMARSAELDPRSLPLTERGIVLYRADRLQEALEDFREAARRDASDFDAWMGQGNCLLRMEKQGQAIEPYEQALGMVPDNPEALLNLAACYLATERPADAVAAYRKILAVDPGHELARKNLSLLQGQ